MKTNRKQETFVFSPFEHHKLDAKLKEGYRIASNLLYIGVHQGKTGEVLCVIEKEENEQIESTEVKAAP